MLTLERLTFQQGGFALDGDLSISGGTVTAVIGPSGAGKSTLLHGIAGFLPMTGGRLVWDGKEIGKLPPNQRPVSMLFQDNNLFPHLTVMQNVALALAPRLRPTQQVQARVRVMLERVGLDGLQNRKPGALSGGQQSRAALARALLQDRPILLMDEPFSALGPGLKAEMLDLSVELAQADGRTVVMVTHEPQDAERVADDILGVVSGTALAPVSASAFLANPPGPFKDYLG